MVEQAKVEEVAVGASRRSGGWGRRQTRATRRWVRNDAIQRTCTFEEQPRTRSGAADASSDVPAGRLHASGPHPGKPSGLYHAGIVRGTSS